MGSRVYITDEFLEPLEIIDDFYTLSWTERHNEAGHFELELPITYLDSQHLVMDNYVILPESSVTMVIMSKQPSTSETSRSLIISGESAEALLKRRSTDKKIDVSGSIETTLYTLVADHFLTPSDPNREFASWYTFDTGTPTNPGDTYADQFEILSIYDICVAICMATGYGFRLVRVANGLGFQVYKGDDRSAEVIFSEGFGNVISSSYIDSQKDAQNLAIVVTDDNVYPRVDVWLAGQPEPTGIARRERTLETTIDRNLDDAYTLTDAEVLAIIRSRGRNMILENQAYGYFEGDFDIDGNFKLDLDFFLGDIVQTVLVDGWAPIARVVEVLRSFSTEGVTAHVTMDYNI